MGVVASTLGFGQPQATIRTVLAAAGDARVDRGGDCELRWPDGICRCPDGTFVIADFRAHTVGNPWTTPALP